MGHWGQTDGQTSKASLPNLFQREGQPCPGKAMEVTVLS